MKNPIIKILNLVLVLIPLLLCLPAQSNTALAIKTSEVDLFDKKNNRPLKVKYWYQASTNECEQLICLSSSQNSRRLAVISHGAFGSPRSMNWLGYALASQGWVVAGVAHFGESWVYGNETIDPSVTTRFWQRPQEVSLAIDYFADDKIFNVLLKNDSVVVLGHSAGGFTAMALAGAKLEAGKSESYCSSELGRSDKGCDYGNQRGNKQKLTSEQLQKIGTLQAEMIDSRIAGVIALDPALGHATSEQSLHAIVTPTLIIGSVDNDFLPYEVHAKYYAKHIQNASLYGVEDGAGHFVYIDECNFQRQIKGVSLCTDRDGVVRKEIQQQVIQNVFSFIYRKGLAG